MSPTHYYENCSVAYDAQKKPLPKNHTNAKATNKQFSRMALLDFQNVIFFVISQKSMDL